MPSPARFCAELFILCLLPASARAVPRHFSPAVPRASSALARGAAGEWELDVLGRHNPPGLAAFATWGIRWPEGAGPEDKSARAAIRLGVTPAYGQAALLGDWVPHPALQFKASYDLFQYWGAFDGLLSFPAHDAPFGDRARNALSGREEAVAAHRVHLQPALRVRAGAWLILNQTDVAHYWMGGRGPYLLELEYDTLLGKRDWLLANRTVALRTIRGVGKQDGLAAGPLFEIVRASGAGLERRRIALAARWTPGRSIAWLDHPRAFFILGLNLADPNRNHQPFVLATLAVRLRSRR